MDWQNERYVRLYIRDTGDMLAVGWQGRALFSELLRKVDRAGVIDEADPDILSELLRIPIAVLGPALARLEARKIVEIVDGKLVIPNFIEAQETRSSDRQRQAESRARRRDQARGGISGDVTKTVTSVTKRDSSVTKRDGNVTPCHTVSQHVTPSLAVLSLTKPNQAKTYLEIALENLYKKYPKKSAKAAGMKSAKKLIRNQADLEALSAAVSKMESSWAGQDLTFCPGWGPFINQRRWEDEQLPAPSKPKPGQSSGPAIRDL